MEENTTIENVPFEVTEVAETIEPKQPTDISGALKVVGLIGTGAVLAELIRFGISKGRIALATHKAKKAQTYNTVNESDVIDLEPTEFGTDDE